MALEKKKFYTCHAIGFLYALTAGYYLLIHEFFQGNYLLKHFHLIRKDSSALDFFSSYIVPINFWSMASGFALLYYLLGIERNVRTLIRQTLLCGLIIYFYSILLTLPLDTPHGDFYWPAGGFDFPFKAEYVFGVVLILFISFYLFIISCAVKGNHSLGYFSTPLFYLPLLPFLYQTSPLIHGSLLLGSAFLGYFFLASRFNIERYKKLIKETDPTLWIIIIFFISVLFRFWHLYYFAFVQDARDWKGLSADGPAYFNQAIGYAQGEPITSTIVTPAYSYILSIFFKVFDFNLTHTLALQGLLSALIPIFVYFICKDGLGFKIAIIASLCTALSFELIYYSVVIQRASMSVFFLTAIVFLTTLASGKFRWSVTILLGFCCGWFVLLDGARSPALLILLIPFLTSLKTGNAKKYIVLLLLGFIVAQGPFNWNYYKANGTTALLGRPVKPLYNWEGGWLEIRHGGKEMVALYKLGFNPIESLSNSLFAFTSNPLEIGALLTKKILKQFQNFFFVYWDPTYLDPIKLNKESYFANCLTFYYVPIFILGGAVFIFSKRIHWKTKFLIGLPVLYSLIFFTAIFYSRSRFGLIILPLILIWFAVGLHGLAKYLFQVEPGHNFKNISFMRSTPKVKEGFDVPLKGKPATNRIGFVGIILSVIFFSVHQIQAWTKPLYNEQKVNFQYESRFMTKGNLPEQAVLPGVRMIKPFSKLMGLNWFREDVVWMGLPEDNIYHLHFKIRKQFGPFLKGLSLEFYLDNVFLEKKALPIPSTGWITLNDLNIKKGLHTIKLKILSPEQASTPTDKNHFFEILGLWVEEAQTKKK